MRTKLMLAAAALIGGPYVTVTSVAQDAWLSAALFFISTMLVAWALVCTPSWLSWELWSSIGGLLTGVAFLGLLHSHPGADARLQRAHGQLSARFASIEVHCREADNRLLDLADAGVSSCAVQPLSDVNGLLTEASRAQLGPGASLLLNVVVPPGETEPDRCLAAYAAARTLCPTAFLSVESEFPELLSVAESQVVGL